MSGKRGRGEGSVHRLPSGSWQCQLMDGYTDQASVSPWAAEGVGALAANGIMKGNGSALSPQEPCSVEQAILLAWRLYAQYGDQAG